MLLELETKSELGIMLKSLKIENFRGFESFELKQLGRVNLLVGENNSGKTSILEAIRLLHSTADLTPVQEQLVHRGELSSNGIKQDIYDLDVRHLFYGHALEGDSPAIVSGDRENGASIQFSILLDITQQNLNLGGQAVYLPPEFDFSKLPTHNEAHLSIPHQGLLNFMWCLKSNLDSYPFPQKEGVVIGLLPKGGTSKDLFRTYRQFDDETDIKLQWVSSRALSAREMIEIFNQIVLTPEEDFVTHSLQIIEPTIRRIAPSGNHNSELGNIHGGFLILQEGNSQRVPIGSLGDGIWRCLGLALAIANAKDGILLVDEIDTGLHFSTMTGMWEMIWKTAERLNIQVFATTHSRDCWESLAKVAEDVQDSAIMIHRIEKNKSESVLFNPHQMAIAAEEGIEVR
jgi:hypothetical protein